jgi:hypothetical protein
MYVRTSDASKRRESAVSTSEQTNAVQSTSAQSSSAQPSAPYVTLLGFTRYVARTGPGRATFVGGLRKQRESKSGFNPHRSLIKALKADIRFHTQGTHLEAVTNTVKPRWQPLYAALTTGALAYLATLTAPNAPAVELVQTRDAIGVIGGLPVKVNPHFGLRYDDGHSEAIRLYFDENPPQSEPTMATLHLMARAMDQILPGAAPVLVDIRRAEVHRVSPNTKPDELERWLAGEAAAFSTMWGTAA